MIKHNRLRIGIDVDGVLRDFVTALLDVMHEHYPEYLNSKIDYRSLYSKNRADSLTISNWKLSDNFNCSEKKIKDIYQNKFKKEILIDAMEFNNETSILNDWMKESNHMFFAVTSQGPTMRCPTLKWFDKYDINFDGVIFTKGKDKCLHGIDILIDDSPVNLSAWSDYRGNDSGYLLVDRPYNYFIDATHRIKDLKEARHIIDNDVYSKQFYN